MDATRESIESAILKTLELKQQSEQAVSVRKTVLECRRSRLEELKRGLIQCLPEVHGGPRSLGPGVTSVESLSGSHGVLSSLPILT